MNVPCQSDSLGLVIYEGEPSLVGCVSHPASLAHEALYPIQLHTSYMPVAFLSHQQSELLFSTNPRVAHPSKFKYLADSGIVPVCSICWGLISEAPVSIPQHSVHILGAHSHRHRLSPPQFEITITSPPTAGFTIGGIKHRAVVVTQVCRFIGVSRTTSACVHVNTSTSTLFTVPRGRRNLAAQESSKTPFYLWSRIWISTGPWRRTSRPA